MTEDDFISREEFEQRRHAFDLCAWVNLKLEALRVAGRFDELYFVSSGMLKKLREEVIPVSRLGLYLSTPESQVSVTCFSGNQNYDAQIDVTGWGARSFRVEVTTTETEKSALRRQALRKYGHVVLTGCIRKVGGEIESDTETAMVSITEEEEQRVTLAIKRLEEKIGSGRYTSDTAVLVYLSEYRPLSLESRAELVQRARHLLYASTMTPCGVYFCYAAGLMIDEAHPSTA